MFVRDAMSELSGARVRSLDRWRQKMKVGGQGGGMTISKSSIILELSRVPNSVHVNLKTNRTNWNEQVERKAEGVEESQQRE